jgi:hypothetical protein
MKTQLSSQDWQMLSAYLDGQLSAQEKMRIEQVLATRQDLRTGLEELRQTRKILWSLPRHKVPHNFTLTRAMAAEQKRATSAWFPFLSFTSLTSVVLVILSMFLRFQSASAPVAMRASAPVQEVASTQTGPPPMIIQWGATGKGGGGGGGGGDVQPDQTLGANQAVPGLIAPDQQPPVVNNQAIPTPENFSAPQPTVSPEQIPGAQAKIAPTTEPFSTTSTAPPEEDIGTAPGENPILGIRPAGEAGQIQPQPYENTLQTKDVVAATGPDYLVLSRWLLAVLALVTGVAALRLRMR